MTWAESGGAASGMNCSQTDIVRLEVICSVDRMRQITCLMPCALFALAMLAATPISAATCESLSGIALKDTTITLAETVAAGAFTLPGSASRLRPQPSRLCRPSAV